MGLISKSTAERLVGAWKCQSWTLTKAGGEVVHPYGPNPRGLIMFSDSGYVSTNITHPDKSITDVDGLSPEQALEHAFNVFSAYCGSYSVDEVAKKVTISVTGAMAPEWIGSIQEREYEFLSDGRLQLSVTDDGQTSQDAGVGGRNVLVWERL